MEKMSLIMLACPGFTDAQKDKVRSTTFQQYLELPLPQVASPARRKPVTLPSGVPGPLVGSGLQMSMNGIPPGHHQMGGQHQRMSMQPGNGMMPMAGGRDRPHSVDFGAMRAAFPSQKRQSGRVEFGPDGTPIWLGNAMDGPHTPPATPPDGRIDGQFHGWPGQQHQHHQAGAHAGLNGLQRSGVRVYGMGPGQEWGMPAASLAGPPGRQLWNQ